MSELKLHTLAASHAANAAAEFSLVTDGVDTRLAVWASKDRVAVLNAFDGQTAGTGDLVSLVGSLSARNAEALRQQLPWLQPSPLGLGTSAGFGDRLGMATPGHVRALKAVGGAIAPIFAQQSIREMTRTGRTPRQVIDAATWGAFAAGWRRPVGADADHLKTTDAIDACAAAGFSQYTIDPGEYVNSSADTASPGAVRRAVSALPWAYLEDSEHGMLARYAGRTFDLGSTSLALNAAAVMCASAKYGAAIAHVTKMYRHLQSVLPADAFELEVSVDETETRTSHAEHLYIATELRRLGVRWVGLAPRYVGRFEKGVDYIGDLTAFDADIAVHAAIARALGPYKLSLHSGSDKFSIYPIVVRHTDGMVHLKTAGTTYLEALRTAAGLAPDLFRGIYAFARDCYERDRASYEVSATLGRAPLPEAVSDADLPSLLDDFDARQILHVTFGSILTACEASGHTMFADEFLLLLRQHPEDYAANLETHFVKHLAPFARVPAKT